MSKTCSQSECNYYFLTETRSHVNLHATKELRVPRKLHLPPAEQAYGRNHCLLVRNTQGYFQAFLFLAPHVIVTLLSSRSLWPPYMHRKTCVCAVKVGRKIIFVWNKLWKSENRNIGGKTYAPFEHPFLHLLGSKWHEYSILHHWMSENLPNGRGAAQVNWSGRYRGYRELLPTTSSGSFLLFGVENVK